MPSLQDFLARIVEYYCNLKITRRVFVEKKKKNIYNLPKSIFNGIFCSATLNSEPVVLRQRQLVSDYYHNNGNAITDEIKYFSSGVAV